MSKNFNTNTKNNDEWITPPYITRKLGLFDLDPCAPVDTPIRHSKTWYTLGQDGLNQQWHGRVWLNPPYGKETFKWLNKLHVHQSGIALIFARTETKGFHSEVWEKADSVFFFRGRLKFYYVDGTEGGTANAPSCLVSYSAFDTDSIKRSGLNGRLVVL